MVGFSKTVNVFVMRSLEPFPINRPPLSNPQYLTWKTQNMENCAMRGKLQVRSRRSSIGVLVLPRTLNLLRADGVNDRGSLTPDIQPDSLPLPNFSPCRVNVTTTSKSWFQKATKRSWRAGPTSSTQHVGPTRYLPAVTMGRWFQLFIESGILILLMG